MAPSGFGAAGRPDHPAGNQNEVVEILNYVTEATYDTVMWQKVQAKALFIDQIRRNEVIDNEVEDLSGGDIGSAAAETKAIATGDPRYVKQVELQDDVKRLSALGRAHMEAGRQRDWRVSQLERSAQRPATVGAHRRTSRTASRQ